MFEGLGYISKQYPYKYEEDEEKKKKKTAVVRYFH